MLTQEILCVWFHLECYSSIPKPMAPLVGLSKNLIQFFSILGLGLGLRPTFDRRPGCGQACLNLLPWPTRLLLVQVLVLLLLDLALVSRAKGLRLKIPINLYVKWCTVCTYMFISNSNRAYTQIFKDYLTVVLIETAYTTGRKASSMTVTVG